VAAVSAQQQPPPEPDGETATQVDEAATAALADLEDRWRRAVADLDNLRKRYARELERERAAERARVAAQFLPVVDDLDRALAHAGGDPGAIVEGVRAVRDHATAVLARLGFPRYEEVGVPFDPARHEAVQAVADADAPPGTVVAVLRPGYGREDRWLRPAAVAVATPPRRG
jgi:molecular chaperone GrpE